MDSSETDCVSNETAKEYEQDELDHLVPALTLVIIHRQEEVE